MNHWVIFGIKLAISSVFGVLITWGVSFYVADYVVKASVGQISLSVNTLQSSLDGLSETVRLVNQDIRTEVRRFDDQRDALAEDIADRIAELRVKDGQQEIKLDGVFESLGRIEESLKEIKGSIPINYMTGGPLEVNKWKAIKDEYGLDDDTPVFIMQQGAVPSPAPSPLDFPVTPIVPKQ
ncbi:MULTISPECIES: hypothetical protein [unclassified Labrenzia]|uniref:hypothetical protein n=1 Tax=unclassified Labrenzia TaxID=2648686 RepID=UPI0012683BD9|nr:MULTISPECIES: hypothetical protein [unclassified Labrenzia]